MKQTAVEWLYNLSKQRELDIFDLEQALAMERIQVIYAYDDGANERHNHPVTGEQYYNEQYGK